ncbi:hypothetical protein M3Y99_00690300 [Aphelenchoides fujianensis]|nr:hypothetical protein M3Y99_00690300 [Aphelenchoides fujianensis]
MRSLLVLSAFALLFAVAFGLNEKKFAKITDQMRCELCVNVVEQEAEWAKLDQLKEGDMLNAAFELCERVFHRGFEQLERLVCDDFATHSAPLVRQQKMVFSRGTHSPRGLCANAGFCSV